MDFVAKLGRMVTPRGRQGVELDPLVQFTRTHDLVQNSLNEATTDPAELAKRLQLLASLLCSESASLSKLGVTGDCYEHLLRHDLVATLITGSLSKGVPIQRLAIQWLATLIASLNDTFLAHNSIHRPVIRLLKSFMPSGSEAFVPDQSLEPGLVQLITGICSRIKHFPDLLVIFFRPAIYPAPEAPPERVTSPTPTHSSAASWQSQAKPAECLLFSCLLCYVHREGAIGHMARTSLLLLIEVAFTTHSASPTQRSARDSEAPKTQEISLLFAEWLLDSDLTEVVAAGLGALYSILPGKLHAPLRTLSGLPDAIPAVEASTSNLQDAVDLKEPEVQSALSVYIALFVFAENVLLISHSCSRPSREKALVSAMLSEAMVAAVNGLFTDNILYLGLLESSADDGTSLAVLVYLNRLFASLAPRGPLATSILENLLRESGPPESSHSSPRKERRASRRKSNAMLLLASRTAPHKPDVVDPAASRPVSLRDVLLQSLRCTLFAEMSQLTRQASLSLFATLLLQHPTSASLLLSETRLSKLPHYVCLQASSASGKEDEEAFVYPGAASRTPSVAQCLLRRVEGIENLKKLGHCLHSADHSMRRSAYEYDRYLASTLDLLAESLRSRETDSRAKVAHSVSVQRCPLVRLLTQSLSSFFLHHAGVNLKLTACITVLACNPQYLIDDWFSEDPFVPAKADLSVLQVLASLVRQVMGLRKTVADFDVLLAERRRSLVLADDLADALIDDSAFTPTQRSPIVSRSTGHSASSESERAFAGHYERTSQIPVELPSLPTDLGMRAKVTLSSVLDNTLVLEEVIKEWAAVLQMRLACGIDAVA